jgi:hypothetical protein
VPSRGEVVKALLDDGDAVDGSVEQMLREHERLLLLLLGTHAEVSAKRQADRTMMEDDFIGANHCFVL